MKFKYRFFIRRNAEVQSTKFREGYKYAKKQLDVTDEKALTESMLRNYVETAKSFGSYTDFDRGVEAALKEPT